MNRGYYGGDDPYEAIKVNAYYRGMAARRMSFMAAHMMAGFDRDEAYDLLCQRLGWEAHQ